MTERNSVITFQGNALTLVGPELHVGDQAPDFVALKNDLSELRFSKLADRVRVICSVPSLDTPVCDAQTRRFNQEAAALADQVAVLTVSMDLPFAQARWCGAVGVDRVLTVSDHRDAEFGLAYGQLIKELRLLARAVFVIDRAGLIKYIEQVPEISAYPDYEATLAAVKACL